MKYRWTKTSLLILGMILLTIGVFTDLIIFRAFGLGLIWGITFWNIIDVYEEKIEESKKP